MILLKNYTVKPGDTLYYIAIRHRISIPQIVALNPGLNPDLIYVGQIIKLPQGAEPMPIIYTVRPGDALYKIAYRFDVSLGALLAANPQLTNFNLIYPGMKITIPEPEPVIKGIILDFVPTDAILDPTRPIIYILNKANNRIYAVNYDTGATKSLSFELPVEAFTLSEGKIYVALLISGHHYYTQSPEMGAVAVLNTSSFTKEAQFNVNIDPFDIVADGEGHIYIPSGSNQWTNFKSFSVSNQEEISKARIYYKSYAKMHPIYDRIYTITTASSPRDMIAYNVSDGIFTDSYDSPYHGGYSLNTYFKISPEGKYIFNSAGTVFTTAINQSEDMKFYTNLNRSFVDIAFNLDANKFYIAEQGRNIVAYDYSTFYPIATYPSQGTTIRLFSKGNKLISVSRGASNKYFIEFIEV